MAACGGPSSGPSPVTQQPPSPGPPSAGPSANLAPVIEGVTVDAARAEVDTDVTLTAVVKDEDTPLDQLTFQWKADAGTFGGEGASVKWRAPKGQTPADYEIALTVTETYGTPDASGVRPQNVSAAKSPVIRVHNSPKELGDMSLQFLSDFANSSIPASVCVRDFTDSCKGKADERADIEWNRAHLDILSSSLALRAVSVNASGITANITVSCTFTSKIRVCDPGDKLCVVGEVGTARGDCLLTGKYEQKRWWLCDSHFLGRLTGSMRLFFRQP
jgi:hypothetical protein